MLSLMFQAEMAFFGGLFWFGLVLIIHRSETKKQINFV